ncbi:beta-lactamase family protein [Muricauda sp. SCSIO 64092]|uniref:serine hydrolase domain-containing protein n=1 Tax=Allomuricauda sp. SCSIO 64092 TaxID=2908842 RepID=UPI001FF4B7CF|nr:serine hydrolase domain-containing protein [Muricauda sp. SCSIO 64092]UOY08071.1 beta-lactamase family protein [Muricauda sp. SCSIO 64092]
MRFKTILLCFLTAMGNTNAQEYDFKKSLDSISKKIDDICAHWKVGPGGVVGIVQDGEIVFSRAYGKASLEHDVPITEKTVFNIASVSKQFTAFSLVLLEEQGRLDLDDDIRKHLPEIPDFGEPITIRHLLTHTSGLRNFQDILAMAGWRGGDAMRREDVLRFVTQQKELNFSPGTLGLYCNTGFILATYIVERVTGMPFDQWTKENLFEPLGMKNTEFREDMEMVMRNTAKSYDRENDGTYKKRFEYYNYMGNGNLYSTLGDLAKWIANFGDKKLGGASTIEKLTQQHVMKKGDTLHYGLGIGNKEHRGLANWSHGGSVGGYRATFSYYPDTDTGFIALSNSSRGNPIGVVNPLIDLYLGDLMEPKPKNEPRYPHLKNEVSIKKKSFQLVAGHYRLEKTSVELYESNGKYYMQSEKKYPKIELLAASDTTFFVRDRPISIYIDPGSGLIDRHIVINDDGHIQHGKKYDPELSKEEHLEQYVGSYYSPELWTTYNFSLKDGKLKGDDARQPEFDIVPYTEDYLIANGFFFNEVKVIRSDKGAVEGIRVSSNRAKNVLFTKQ